jgi:CRP-like cAMP-binding protein
VSSNEPVARWGDLQAQGALPRAIEHEDGHVLSRRGEEAVAFWILVEGALEVFQPSPDGRSYLARILLPTSIACLKECLANESAYLQTVRVLERARVVRLSRAEGAAILQAHPALCLQTLVEVSRAFCGAARLEANRMHKADSLLANVLLSYTSACGEPWDGGVRMRVKRTQSELADCVGSNERSVNRLLSSWKDDGLIDKKDARYLVKDRQRLAALVEDDLLALVHHGKS